MASLPSSSKGERSRRYDLAFRVYAKYGKVLDRLRPAGYEALICELCNTQSCLRYFKDAGNRYNPSETPELSQLLYCMEGLLSEMNGREPSDIPEAEATRYRRLLCLYTYLAFAHILILVLHDPVNEIHASLVRLESLLVSFHEQWQNPVQGTDLMNWLRASIPTENPIASPIGSPIELPGTSQVGFGRFPMVPQELAGAPLHGTAGATPGLSVSIPTSCSSNEASVHCIPLPRAYPGASFSLDLAFLRDIGDDGVIRICHILFTRIQEWLGSSTQVPRGLIRSPTRPLYRIVQNYGSYSRRLLETNFLGNNQQQGRPGASSGSTTQPLSLPFVGWSTERWLRLVLWWLTKSKYQNPSHAAPALFQNSGPIGSYIDNSSQHSNFQLSKAIYVMHAVLGGRAIIQLLDDKTYKIFVDMQQAVWRTSSEQASQLSAFLAKLNGEISHQRFPGVQRQSAMPQRKEIGGGYPSGHLSLIDQSHQSEARDDTALGNLEVKFTRLCTLEFNNHPRAPQIGSFFAMLEVGYTSQAPRTPHFRLMSPKAEIIVSKDISQWSDLSQVDAAGDPGMGSVMHQFSSISTPFLMTYYTQVRGGVFVNFALPSAEDRSDFERHCGRITKGDYLAKKQKWQWAMSGAGYEGGEVGSHISYRCDEGKITIEDQMLPGSTSGSRRRQIILEPSWEWDPRPPLTIPHVSLNRITVFAEESGRVQLEWTLDRLEENEYHCQPYLNYQIHHYHRDQYNHLLCDKEHGFSVPEEESRSVKVSSEHAQCHGVCKREGDCFSHEVTTGVGRWTESSWTCPYFRGDNGFNPYGRHYVDIYLSRPKAIQELLDVILQIEPDVLTLEKKLASYRSIDGGSDTWTTHIFTSDLFPGSARVVEYYKDSYFTHRADVSFITWTTNLESLSGRNGLDYRLSGLLSHPFGCRRFDGDVGEKWAHKSNKFSVLNIPLKVGQPRPPPTRRGSTRVVMPTTEWDIAGLFRPFWKEIYPSRTGTGAFKKLEVFKSDANRSEPPIVKMKKGGQIRFYKDESRKTGNLLCWVDGEDGRSFVYWKVIEFCHGLIAAGMRGVFNNRLTMKVLYEANSITNDIRDSGLQGIVRLEFGQGSSVFEDFHEAANRNHEASGSIYGTGTPSGRTSIHEVPG